MVSVLEERFPHVIQRLVDSWNDPDYFDLVYADLTIDKRGGRTGWPMEAWLELVFLQEIHERVFSSRKPACFMNLAPADTKRSGWDQDAGLNLINWD